MSQNACYFEKAGQGRIREYIISGIIMLFGQLLRFTMRRFCAFPSNKVFQCNGRYVADKKSRKALETNVFSLHKRKKMMGSLFYKLWKSKRHELNLFVSEK